MFENKIFKDSFGNYLVNDRQLSESMRSLNSSWKHNVNSATGLDKKLKEPRESYTSLVSTLNKLQPVPDNWHPLQPIPIDHYEPIRVYKKDKYRNRTTATDLIIEYQIDSDTQIAVVFNFNFDSGIFGLVAIDSYLDFKGSKRVTLMDLRDARWIHGYRYKPPPPGNEDVRFRNVNTPHDPYERETKEQKEKKEMKFQSGWLHTMFILQFIQSVGIQKFIKESDIHYFDVKQIYDKCTLFINMIGEKMRTLFPSTPAVQEGGSPAKIRYEDRTKVALLQLAQNRNIKQATSKTKKADLIRLLRRRQLPSKK